MVEVDMKKQIKLDIVEALDHIFRCCLDEKYDEIPKLSGRLEVSIHHYRELGGDKIRIYFDGIDSKMKKDWSIEELE